MDTAPKQGTRDAIIKEIWDTIKFVVIALAIVIPVRMYIAQPFVVSGESMYPTFHDREYLIVDEISYRLDQPERGDVIVFRYPNDPDRFFIKRIIGLPYEQIRIQDEVVTIINERYPEGITLDEPYRGSPMTGTTRLTLQEGEYFVMGDNRNASSDSRIWGPLPADHIVGRALIRIFPLKSFAWKPGSYGFPGLIETTPIVTEELYAE